MSGRTRTGLGVWARMAVVAGAVVAASALLSAGLAEAAPAAPGGMSAVGSATQDLQLQLGMDDGGQGDMQPQAVLIADAEGTPIVGVPVTWTAAYSIPIYASMPPHGQTTYVTNTDANGVARAANTSSGYQGNGFSVYSTTRGVTRTLRVTASADGYASVPFTVNVTALPQFNYPLTLTAHAGDAQVVQLAQSVRAAGGLGQPNAWQVRLTDAANDPVPGVTMEFQATNIGPVNVTVTAGNSFGRSVTNSNGVASVTALFITSSAPGGQGGYQVHVDTLHSAINVSAVVLNGTVLAWSPPPAPEGAKVWSVSEIRQQVRLVAGGYIGMEAFMTPQEVLVTNGDCVPLAGVGVTWTVTYSHPIYASMPPHGQATYVTNTDANGIARAANTSSGYLGTGYQVYSYAESPVKILRTTASIAASPEAGTAQFEVQVATPEATMPPLVQPSAPTALPSADNGFLSRISVGTAHPRHVGPFLIATASLDFGDKKAELLGPVTIRYGTKTISLPHGMRPNRRRTSWIYVSPDRKTRVLVRPPRGDGSRGRIAVTEKDWSDTLLGDVLHLGLEATIGGLEVGADVQLVAGRHRSGIESATSPDCAVQRVVAGLSGSGDDTVALQLEFAGDGMKPPVAPEIHLRIGAPCDPFEVRLPTPDHQVQSTSTGYRYLIPDPDGVGPLLPQGAWFVDVDFARRHVRAHIRGVDLGTFPLGSAPLYVSFGIDGEEHAVQICAENPEGDRLIYR